jgi:hypothetical protein
MVNHEQVGLAALAQFEGPDDAERWLLNQPQTECPLVHHFGPGVYIREFHAPAGTLVVGHKHRGPMTNILLKGALLLAGPNGPQRLEAPALFVSPPGRKMAYVLEDMVFQNVRATELTDLDEIENHFVEKSQQWLAHHGETNQ